MSTKSAVERWEEKCRTLKEDMETDIGDSWQMTAVRMMLCSEIEKAVDYDETTPRLTTDSDWS